MPLTDTGRNLIAQAIVGEAITTFNNANAHLGVGGGAGGTTAFAATQTNLQGASTQRKAMDATYPTRATNVLTFRSTFGTSEANFTWDEWGVFNASTAGTMLSRKVEALGTKQNTQSWQLTADLTINNP